MNINIPVSAIMTKKLATLTVKDTLYDAEKLFKKHNIRHIPIVDGSIIIGVLSYSDLLKISYTDVTDDEEGVESIVYDMFTIQQVMAKVPLTVTENATVKEVVEILTKHTFHSLPVVKNENELVGILTTTDLLNYFLTQE